METLLKLLELACLGLVPFAVILLPLVCGMIFDMRRSRNASGRRRR